MWAGNTVLNSVKVIDILSRSITFTFTNSKTSETNVVTDNFSDVSEESLKRYVRNRENALDALDSLDALVGQTIQTVTAVDPGQSAINAFTQQVQTKKKMEVAIAAGDKKASDQDYIDTVTSVKQSLSVHPEWIVYYQ